MGIYLFFQKTFLSMLGIKRTIALVVLGIIVPVLLGQAGWNNLFVRHEAVSLTMQTQFILDRISSIWYFWGAGFLLTVTLVASAAGFISKEATDGTLMVAVAKPINRYEIIVGKLLALIVYSIMLAAFTYLLSILLLWGILHFDMDSLEALLGLMPAILLYIFVVTLFFGSIATALSATIGSRVKIVVICMVLVIITSFGGAIVRSILNQTQSTQYEDVGIYAFDIGYHMGNTFDLTTRSVSFWQMSPIEQGDSFGIITGTYNSPSGQGVGERPNPTNYMHSALSLIIMLLVSTGAVTTAVWGINRKQL